ncbi:unnamed protein product [Arctia plantaginis]|uniref:Peptidase C1A papain C-terminal domain-containing protein n=1 Tax=Arctia plantaginis TaxID=874455 RepID=A0A8S1B086_ARCPL|nr:unnamed protein product [Arctia plantaginis]
MRNVRGRMLAVAFCLLGAVHLISTASLKENEQRHRQHLDPVHHQQHQETPVLDVQRRTRGVEQWLSLISEIARVGAKSELSRSGNTFNNIFLPSPIKLDGQNTTLQLVLIPVPGVPSQYRQSLQFDTLAPNFASVFTTPNVSPPNIEQSVITSNVHTPYYIPPQSSTQDPNIRGPTSHHVYQSTSSPGRKPTTQPPQVDKYEVNQLPVVNVKKTQESVSNDQRRAQNSLIFLPVEDSQQLLMQFRAQLPRTPSWPPIVIEPLVVNATDDEVVEVSEIGEEQQSTSSNENGQYGPSESTKNCRSACQESSSNYGTGPDPVSGEAPPSPPLPRFERSIMVEAILSVPRADYSEPYTLWWDAASGASRIEHHGGTASSYRIMRLDGRVQSVHVRLDRTGESDVRRCTLLEPRRVTLAERAIPVLPDLSGFKFAGYIEVKSIPKVMLSRVERWVNTVSAPAGASGASRGEVLTYRHELLVARAQDNLTTTPLRYAVAVDSSVLGVNCDSYIHRFLKVYTRNHDSSTFSFDIADACDHLKKIDEMELVEPFREFTKLQRDPKYDDMLTRFKRQNNRQYADDLEETIRKNILIQSSRFMSSGNRKGSSLELGMNFLADRLRDEMKPLYGIDPSVSSDGDMFPHSKEELRRMSSRLPQKFDWRERGGVTHVRNQSLCSSCWAFTVVGAVEGALFARTGRLVPLSEQVLLDCGHRSGAKGCGPTWPRFAYDYIRDNGLPALDEYSPYVAKVQECNADRVAPVTRISSHVNVTSKNLLALKVAIRKHGPTVVLMDGDTSSLQLYKKGFYHDAKCKKNSSSHAMLAVGWTVHRGETYFILKNSWSVGWGEEGYIYMRGATNTCGLLRLPSYPVLQRNNVLRIPSSARSAVAPVKTSE